MITELLRPEYHREFLLSAQFCSLVCSEQGLQNPNWLWTYSVPYCRHFWSHIILDGAKTLLETSGWACFRCQWPLEIYNCCHAFHVSYIPERGVRNRELCSVGYPVPRMPRETHEGRLGGHSSTWSHRVTQGLNNSWILENLLSQTSTQQLGGHSQSNLLDWNGAVATWRMEVYIGCDWYSNNKQKKLQSSLAPTGSLAQEPHVTPLPVTYSPGGEPVPAISRGLLLQTPILTWDGFG